MLNSVTLNEWVRLKATLISIHNTRFLCSKCKAKYPTQPERQETEQRVKGCHGIRDQVIHKAEGINFKTCIGNFFSEQAMEWIEFHGLFDKGVMPFPGAYTDQPAKVIEVLRIIGNYKLEWEIERHRERALKQKVGTQRGR